MVKNIECVLCAAHKRELCNTAIRHTMGKFKFNV